MKAFKVFDPNWKCRGMQYAIGETYRLEENGNLVEPVLCEKGFHSCRKVNDCFKYYEFNPANKVAEVELLGTILGLDDDKQCTNIIKIIKEISWNDMLILANTGNGCSGHSNSGHHNSGNYNSGDRNSGNSNSGNYNSGNHNSGNHNSGNHNSGNHNSGYWNSGYRNSGNSNSGNSNSGYRNSGNSNSGNWNSGNSNSGNRNSGNSNSGNWNSGNSNSGFFNSISPNKIYVFNELILKEKWELAKKPDFINFTLCKWIVFSQMTDQQKIDNPKAFVCDGYLKTYSYKEAWANSFKNATLEDIELLKLLPNFNAKVFEEISGIKIN